MRTTRRAALAGGLLLPLTACTGGDEPAPRPVPVDPDVALRAAAVQRERDLLAAYDAALRQDPAAAARLAPVRAEHAAHLVALGEQEAPATAPVTPRGPTPAPRTSAPPATSTLAATPTPTDLPAAERAAAAAHADATAAASPALAAVLAQLAASEASHPVALA